MPPRTTGTSGERFLAALAIDQRTAIGACAALPAGRVGIIRAQFAVGGVAVDHRIHVAGGDAEKQVRFAEHLERFFRMPVRLRNDTDTKTLRLEQAADDGHTERRMVHIGIAGDDNDVAGIPAKRIHLRPGHGQEFSGAVTLRPVLRVVVEGCVGAGDGVGRHRCFPSLQPCYRKRLFSF